MTILLFVLFPFHHALSSISIPGTADSSNEGQSTLVLYGATLIDGTAANPKANSVIVINGDRITSIIEKNQYHISTNTHVHLINLTGYYIIPGLFDMHAHVANIQVSSYNYTESIGMLHKLLSWGITTIRNPGGPTEQAVMLRDMVNAGRLIGPQIFTAGNLGTRESGKQADLIILRQNPLSSISYTKSIVMVIQDGQLVSGPLTN